MSELNRPQGWESKTLLDLASYINGFPFTPSDWSETGLPIVRIAQITGSSSECDYFQGSINNIYKLETKDIVFSWSGTLCVVRWRGGQAWLNQHLFRVIPFPDIDNDFFFHLLSNAVEDMEKSAHGSTMKHIKRGELKKYHVVIPSSLKEQQKIAQILDTLNTKIHKTEALIAKLDKIKEGLLQDLLTRGIDQNGQLRPTPEQAPQLYKESALGLIPKEWYVSDLGATSLSSVIGPFGSDLVASDYRSEGVPVVFVRDIASTKYNRVSEVFVDPRKAKALSAHEVKPGDLLLTKMGLPPCISAVYPESEPAGVITADIVRLRLKADVAPEWAHYFINSEAVKSQVRGITAGVTRPKVTLKDVRSLKIAIPDFEEQARILNIIQHSSSRLESEGANLEKLKAQKSGLMDDLLTGRVRVTSLLANS